MDCLKDILCGNRVIIGIRDYVACDTPEADLWLNDLPGISLKIAANVAGPEVSTGAELMRKCINNAVKHVFDDFDKAISPYFDVNAIVETRELNDFRDAEILPVANLFRGPIIKRWRSELALIYIEELYLYFNTSASGDLKIYAGAELLQTIPVTFEAGKMKAIRVEKIFKAEEIRIELDNSNVEVFSAPINEWDYRGCGGCHSGSHGLIVKGWDGTQEDTYLYGIGVKASARCYNESLICSVLPKLYLPIWYKSGSFFMKEKIYTDRLNPITTFTKEKAKELYDDYEYEYRTRYDATAKNIQGLLRSTKGECLTCNGSSYAQITP